MTDPTRMKSFLVGLIVICSLAIGDQIALSWMKSVSWQQCLPVSTLSLI